MAPLVANTTPPVHGHAHVRRQLPRIVPAIPHRLARAVPATARPVTPEESTRGAAGHHGPELRDDAEVKRPDNDQPPASAGEAPMTPDSRASVSDKDADPSVLAASPAISADTPVQQGQGQSASLRPLPRLLRVP